MNLYVDAAICAALTGLIVWCLICEGHDAAICAALTGLIVWCLICEGHAAGPPQTNGGVMFHKINDQAIVEKVSIQSRSVLLRSGEDSGILIYHTATEDDPTMAVLLSGRGPTLSLTAFCVTARARSGSELNPYARCVETKEGACLVGEYVEDGRTGFLEYRSGTTISIRLFPQP